jgi:ribosomal protein L27
MVHAFNLPFGCRKNGRKSNRKNLGAKIYSRSMGDSVPLAMAGIFIA